MGDTVARGFFYSKQYTCLFCGAEFRGHRLYPTAREKIEKWNDFFDIPYYEAKDPAAFADFLCVEVKVCPGCAFASNDDGQFHTERQDNSWKPEAGDREAMSKLMTDRKAIAIQGANLQSFPRDASDAIVAYKLGIHSATTLFNVSARRYAVETMRMGNYAHKAALLSQKAGQPERVTLWRKAAMEYFRHAFQAELKGAIHWRGVYQLGALAIHFGDDTTASRCFEYLRGLYDKEPDRDLHRYMERLRRIWQDRDLHRAPVA